jgi:hypothetical protein
MRPIRVGSTGLLTTLGFLCALTAVFAVTQVQRVNASSACCGDVNCGVVAPSWRCIGPEDCELDAAASKARRRVDCCWGAC